MTQPTDVVSDFLKNHRLAVLATGRKDGTPQQSLIGYQYDGNDFAISARRTSAKATNLRRRSGVSLSIVDGGQIVVVYGTAKVVRDPEEVVQLNLNRLQRGPDPVDEAALRARLASEERVVIVVTPERYLPSRI